MRRFLIASIAALVTIGSVAVAQAPFPRAQPGHVLVFPRDEGSHPEFRTEWWYLTGWLEDDAGKPLGFQVTFFRRRPGTDEANPSRFAAKQVLFAHASLSDPNAGRLLRDERTARAGFGLAEAREADMDVYIDDWRLQRRAADRVIDAKVATDEFSFDLELRAEQPPLLQGHDGFSQKGPEPAAASHYYSLPQLRATGSVVIRGQRRAVRGTAWLDHEWFDLVLDGASRGWDWTGLNLDDGSAVMAFRMRNEQGEEHWASGTWRERGATRTFDRDAIDWRVIRRWRSARTGVEFPVEWQVRVGERTIRLRPLVDDQENDARGSTGTLYWEGPVRAYDEADRYIGRGYLELTGYGSPIRM
jgi:predicted secreted hydrolase